MSRIDAAEVARLASLARVGVSAEQIPQLVAELNEILGHMDALAGATVSADAGQEVPTSGMPLRSDGVVPQAGEGPLAAVAPLLRDGFVLVPRLGSHDGDKAS